MLSISYILIAIIICLIWVIYRTIKFIKTKEFNIMRELTIFIFLIYILTVINLTLCKTGSLLLGVKNYLYVNLVPLVETFNMFNDMNMGVNNALYNVIGNILIFIPLGFFIPLLYIKRNNLRDITICVLCTSVLIEAIQLLTPANITDIDDVIFNTLGGILGFFFYKLFQYIKVRLGKR